MSEPTKPTSEKTKPTSEKIFDILGSLVADPFRRWLIVGYVIFNPDLFILIFTSKQKFEIFQQYFKFQYCPWLSFFAEYSGFWYGLCYNIAFPLLFAVFWCFAYPRFEIWHRERMKENQDKIKDIKDNNILQTKINKLNEDLKEEKKRKTDILTQKKLISGEYIWILAEIYHNMYPKINEYIKTENLELTKGYIRNVFNSTEGDNYKHCIPNELANRIKREFDYKDGECLYIDVTNALQITNAKKCITYLKLITLNNELDANTLRLLDNSNNKAFLIQVMYRLYQLKNTPNDKI